MSIALLTKVEKLEREVEALKATVQRLLEEQTKAQRARKPKPEVATDE